MPERAQAAQVQFAIDDLGRGGAIAEAVLAARLAACVQRVGPVRSRYHWDGELQEAEEWLFLCKTSATLAEALVARIAELHPYDTPEILTIAVAGGLDRYLDWIATETARVGG